MRAKGSPGLAAGASDLPAKARAPACVVIASRNGASHIGDVVRRAAGQCPVFVVSDASSDNTAWEARAAGAQVLELRRNIGKPAAVGLALERFGIVERFKTVAVIDDDTTLAPDFVRRCIARMRNGVAIVVGRTMSDWNRSVRWNIWVAARAFAYWKFQLFVRRGQSVLNVMNCISGSNSMYRSEVLARLTSGPIPYIVDDTYWTLETHRRKLGRIAYAPKARAWVQDPTTLADWYRQNLRWLWGTMQGIHGHRIGRRLSGFDIAYLGLMLDWVLYVLVWPTILVMTFIASGIPAPRFLLWYFAGYLLWATLGALALRQWRLLVLAPGLIVIDWVQRVNFLHALWRTIRQPRIDECRWASPRRHEPALVR
jgi:biofilm PGA synthesis N-glycosyltransferase PgaC